MVPLMVFLWFPLLIPNGSHMVPYGSLDFPYVFLMVPLCLSYCFMISYWFPSGYAWLPNDAGTIIIPPRMNTCV